MPALNGGRESSMSLPPLTFEAIADPNKENDTCPLRVSYFSCSPLSTS